MDTERPVWRNSLSLLAFNNKTDYRPRALQQTGEVMKLGVTNRTSQLRCMIYGLVNNKANPLAWRKEVLSIPTAMVTEHELVERLQKGVDVSEAAGEILEGTARIFMRAVLPENTRESEIRDKVQATGILRHYWDLLERHFQQFLLEIESGNAALEVWEARVKGRACAAFESCMRQRCADTAKTYRAWLQATRFLNSRLARLH
jgi:CRISPR system Cascade subunit CasA